MYHFFFQLIRCEINRQNGCSIEYLLYITQVMALDSLSTICEIAILRSVWYLRKIYEEFEDRFHSRTFWICPPYLHLFLTSLFPFSLSVYICIHGFTRFPSSLLLVSGYLFYLNLNCTCKIFGRIIQEIKRELSEIYR